jgi:CRP/FNR family transcriptional regulator
MEKTIQAPAPVSSPLQRTMASDQPNLRHANDLTQPFSLAKCADGGLADFDGAIVGRRRVARNASAYREQDHFEALFYVRFGQFKLTRRNSAGEPYVARFCMAGDWIGLDAIATERHGFKLTALENREVCEISFAAMKRIMASEPMLLGRFLKSMSSFINDQADHCAVLSRPSLDGRFAGFLLELGAKYERLGYSGKCFRLGMTRGDIGSYLGTSVESISRLVARFNAQQSVLIEGREVQILNQHHLKSKIAAA